MQPAFTSIFLLLLASIASAGTMQTIHSRHYTIHSDLPVATVDQVAAEMDDLYEEYQRRLASLRPTGEVQRLQVYLFATRAGYEAFDTLPNSAGVFNPGRNYLAARLEGIGRDDFRRTLQHEAFHQFVFNRISPAMPTWLNEGLAQVFEDGYWFDGSFYIGQVPPQRLAELRRCMEQRRLIDLRSMLAMSRPQWNARMTDRTAASAQYIQAWAMAHMLIFATEGTGEPYYRPHLIDMLRRLNHGASGDQAFRQAFSDNIDGFQQRFLAYIRSLQPDERAIYLDKQRTLAETILISRSYGHQFQTIGDLRDMLMARMANAQMAHDQRTALENCFRMIDGRIMPSSALHFARNPYGHLPDIICRPGGAFQIRTRFYITGDNNADYEVLVEPTR